MADALVVGANGFLGSHLVAALLDAGHNVRMFDRYTSGEVPTATDRVEVIRGEFLSRTDLEAAVDGMQLVFHFLSTTTPATSESDPTLDVRTNVAQSIELWESCVQAGVEHVYFASTGGAIYGPQNHDVYVEDDRALPVSPYGIGKLTIEHYLHYFRQLHGLRSTIFRISNPYGPGQHPNKLQGLIPIALRQIMRDLPVTVLGDGSMVRDYVYVGDVVQMIMRVVAADPEHEIYNLGSGRGTSVLEVLDTIREVVGHDFPIRHAAVPATFVDRVVLDAGRFRREFGDVPLTDLGRGVALTAESMGLA